MSRDRDDDRRSSRRDDDDRDSRRSSSRDRDDDRDTRSSRRDRDDRDDDRGRGRDSRDRDDDRGTGRAYQYQARSAEDVDERAEMGGKDYDKLLKPGVKIFKVRDGENTVRFLPPTWKDAKHFGLDVYVHYGVGPDRGTYLCINKHGAGGCPVCEERDSVRGESKADEQYIKDLEAKRRVLVYLVDREDERAGEQAWFMPWTLDKDISKSTKDRQSGEVLPIDHPEDGYDVMFDKSGAKRNTKYDGVQLARRSSPLGKREWLENAMDNPLPSMLKVYDADHIAKVFGARGATRDSRERDSDRDRDDDRRGSRDRDRDRDDDRDTRRSTRDRDDDREDRDQRSSRSREDGRGLGDDGRYRDRDRDGGRDRDDDRSSRGRDRDRSDRDDEPTYESVHKMTRTELEDLVELKKLPIKPREAKDDEDLADWVCTEMKLEKPTSNRRSRVDDDDKPKREERDGGDDRLREMRRRRED